MIDLIFGRATVKRDEKKLVDLNAKRLLEKEEREKKEAELRKESAKAIAEIDTESAELDLNYRTKKTAAQLQFEEVQRTKMLKKRAEESAETSHRQKIEKFNKYLNGLSEHYDIPKVGPG